MGEGDSEEDKEIRKKYPHWSAMSNLEKVAVLQEPYRDGCFPEHDDSEWYIMRNHGRWSAYGSFDTHRLCGVSVDFELPFHARFADPATPPIDLDALKNRIAVQGVSDLKSIKGVSDFFWSPDNSLLIVLIDMDEACTEKQPAFCPEFQDHSEFPFKAVLQVYSPHDQDLGKPVLSISLKSHEQPVMVEWETGSNVARWTAELAKIKAQGLVKPLLSSSSHTPSGRPSR